MACMIEVEQTDKFVAYRNPQPKEWPAVCDIVEKELHEKIPDTFLPHYIEWLAIRIRRRDGLINQEEMNEKILEFGAVHEELFNDDRFSIGLMIISQKFNTVANS